MRNGCDIYGVQCGNGGNAINTRVCAGGVAQAAACNFARDTFGLFRRSDCAKWTVEGRTDGGGGLSATRSLTLHSRVQCTANVPVRYTDRGSVSGFSGCPGWEGIDGRRRRSTCISKLQPVTMAKCSWWRKPGPRRR